MKQLINNIKNIPGVVGVAIFKDDGSLVGHDFPPAYDGNMLRTLGLKFQPIKEILPQDEGEIVYLCWEFEELLGFYYPVSGGWVNIISSDQIPMPVFSLTMTAVSNKLPDILHSPVLQGQGASGSGMVEAPIPPAAVFDGEDTVTKEKMETVEKFFADYVGPVAAVLFKRTAKALGFTLDSVPKSQFLALINGVLAKVPEDKKAEVSQKAQQFI